MTDLRAVRAVLAGVLLALLVACGGTTPQAQQPEKPGQFSISALSAFCVGLHDAGVRLTWSAADRADGYVIVRDGTALVTLGAGSAEYSDTVGLTAGAEVTYQVRAVNAGGETLSEPESFTVPSGVCDVDVPAPPAPVADLAASFVCGPPSGAQLTWSMVAGAASYVLDRDHLEVATLGADAVSYTDATVQAGDTHTYVLRAVNGTGLSLSAPVTVDVPFTECGLAGPTVAAGDAHSLAITQDGTVWAWGTNASGQLGIGTYDLVPAPTRVLGLERAVAVAAGDEFSLALDEDGRVWSWGENGTGQLGRRADGTAAPSPVELGDTVVSIAAGSEHSLAVTKGGSVWAWGWNDFGQLGQDPVRYSSVAVPYRIEGLTDVVRVFAHGNSSFALHADGSLSAWGSNNDGMLGTGDTVSSHLPRAVVGLEDVSQIATGTHHSLALTAAGQVYVWGESPMLGLGTTAVTQWEPQAHPELDDVVWIAAAMDRALAVHEDGRVSVWGYVAQEFGQNATVVWAYEPVAVAGLTDALAVFAGADHSLALLEDGSLVDWGFNHDAQLSVNLPLVYGEFVPLPVDQMIRMATSGTDTSLALLAGGTVLSWGASYTGVSGVHHFDAVPLPTVVDSLSNITALSSGDRFSLALDTAGNVWSWGYGISGRLGHGDGYTQATPKRIESAAMPSVIAISAGLRHSLAIDVAGDIWAWGQGANGRLGDGASTQRDVPVPVVGLPHRAVAVSAGDTHSLAVLEDGTVWAWGGSANGKLGLGMPLTDQYVPVHVAVVPPNAVDVIAAGDSSYALLADGTVWAWGANWHGQLGDGTYTFSAVPKLVSGLTGIVGLSATVDTVLAHTGTGDVFGWGDNVHGQLGHWYPDTELEPLKLAAPLGVTSVFAGERHTLIVAGGQLFGSGSDEDRLLGMGQVLHRSVPAPVNTGVPLAGLGL